MRGLLGMIIGAAIDRRDGDSGVRGALVGAAVQGGARALVPLAASAAAGWLIYKGARRWSAGRTGDATGGAGRSAGAAA